MKHSGMEDRACGKSFVCVCSLACFYVCHMLKCHLRWIILDRKEPLSHSLASLCFAWIPVTTSCSWFCPVLLGSLQRGSLANSRLAKNCCGLFVCWAAEGSLLLAKRGDPLFRGCRTMGIQRYLVVGIQGAW